MQAALARLRRGAGVGGAPAGGVGGVAPDTADTWRFVVGVVGTVEVVRGRVFVVVVVVPGTVVEVVVGTVVVVVTVVDVVLVVGVVVDEVVVVGSSSATAATYTVNRAVVDAHGERFSRGGSVRGIVVVEAVTGLAGEVVAGRERVTTVVGTDDVDGLVRGLPTPLFDTANPAAATMPITDMHVTAASRRCRRRRRRRALPAETAR